MSKTLELLEIKLKKHNWNWSTSNDVSERTVGQNNFDDIQRLITVAKKEGKANEAYALLKKYAPSK